MFFSKVFLIISKTFTIKEPTKFRNSRKGIFLIVFDADISNYLQIMNINIVEKNVKKQQLS